MFHVTRFETNEQCKKTGCLLYIGDEILPSHLGIVYIYIIKNKPSWFIRILSLNNLVFHGFSLPPAAFLPWVFQPQGPFVGIRNHTRRKRRNLLHLRGAQIRPLLNLDREGRYLGVVGKIRLERKLVAWDSIVRG